jgi:hypothetical protein
MKEDMPGMIEVFVILLIIVALPVGCFIGWKSFTCNQRATSQDLKSGDYGITKGCVFTLKDGRKVNEKNYRVI